jgi:tripartite-type tricarboxylate transporter receptor subunit TctC
MAVPCRLRRRRHRRERNDLNDDVPSRPGPDEDSGSPVPPRERERTMQIRKRRTPWKVASLVMALGLVLAACGDGDGGIDPGGDTDTETEDEGLGEDEEAEPDEDVETDESAFYHDAEIEIIAPFAAGGGTDSEARFMAPYLANHIPGPPSTVGVFNIAGAGGTIGNNQWWNERDHEAATSLLYSSASSFFPWVFEEPALDLDYTQMVGVFGSQVGAVVYVNDDTGIESTEDFVAAVQDGSVSFVAGEQTPDSLGLLFMIAYELLGMDHNVIMGYEGRGPARVSLEQGELNINWDTSPSWPDVEALADAGTVVPVFTIGQMEDGELVEDPFFGAEVGLPNFAEVYEMVHGEAPSGELYEAFQNLVLSGLTLQKVMWLHQDAPDEAIQEMVAGFENMVNDPEFEQQASEILGDYPKIVGDEVGPAVEDLIDFPEDQRNLLIDWMVENYDYQDPRG